MKDGSDVGRISATAVKKRRVITVDLTVSGGFQSEWCGDRSEHLFSGMRTIKVGRP